LKWADGKLVKSEIDQQVCDNSSVLYRKISHIYITVYLYLFAVLVLTLKSAEAIKVLHRMI